jgi:hypothetical protein
MNRRTDFAGGVIYVSNKALALEDLYACLEPLLENFNFRLLYVRASGRDKNAIEFIVNVGDGDLKKHLKDFERIETAVNRVTNNAVISKDISTGIGFVFPLDF